MLRTLDLEALKARAAREERDAVKSKYFGGEVRGGEATVTTEDGAGAPEKPKKKAAARKPRVAKSTISIEEEDGQSTTTAEELPKKAARKPRVAISTTATEDGETPTGAKSTSTTVEAEKPANPPRKTAVRKPKAAKSTEEGNEPAKLVRKRKPKATVTTDSDLTAKPARKKAKAKAATEPEPEIVRADSPKPTPSPLLRRKWTPVRDTVSEEVEQRTDAVSRPPTITERLGALMYISDSSQERTSASVQPEPVLKKRRRIEVRI